MLMVSSVTGLLMSSVTGSLLCSASNVSWLPKINLARRRRDGSGGLLPPKTMEDIVLVDDLRGGGLGSSAVADVSSEEIMREYLEDASEVRKFHIQGWRWHTMSFAREAERLQKLALRLAAADQHQQTQETDMSSLQQAADYVVNFNLKALHRVEDMFFPWIRQRMNESPVADEGMKLALSNVMDDLQADQRKLAALGETLMSSIQNSKSSTAPLVARKVALQSREIMDLTRSMLEREITLVIPTVGLCIPEKEQKKFNNQVISFLGVFESRTHLVHMHEVVAEADNKLEQELWQECIPSLPRSMIPRWKRTLYSPKASMLDVP